tara:strand:+ start:762 stop:980 length:219 start_codon:yes stop_codon:yes gene_type:complete
MNMFGWVDDLQKLYDSIEDMRRIHIKDFYGLDGNMVFDTENSYQQFEELDICLCQLWENYCNLKDENQDEEQ